MVRKKSRTSLDGKAGREPSNPKKPPPKRPRRKQPCIVRPLIKVRLRGWPPDDLTRKESMRLARQITRDLEKTLKSLASAPTSSPKPTRLAAMGFAESEEAEAGATAVGGDENVDCHRTAVGYEIVEIDGVPTRCRVEYFTCTDGHTFRRVFPLA